MRRDKMLSEIHSKRTDAAREIARLEHELGEMAHRLMTVPTPKTFYPHAARLSCRRQRPLLFGMALYMLPLAACSQELQARLPNGGNVPGHPGLGHVFAGLGHVFAGGGGARIVINTKRRRTAPSQVP